MKRRAERRRPLSTAKKIELTLRRVPAMLLVCVLLCIGFFIAKKLIRPIIIYARDKGEITQMERELKQINAENRQLTERNAYLKTPEGAQTEARKLGYVRPGEVPYLLQRK